jgi:hypothetical protein
MFEFVKNFFNNQKYKVYLCGPNNFAELLKQFDQPPKIKTQEDIIRDYTVKETMASLELSYLRADPAICYTGGQVWYNESGNKFYDFVPCVVRPEVLYCCYGKS